MPTTMITLVNGEDNDIDCDCNGNDYNNDESNVTSNTITTIRADGKDKSDDILVILMITTAENLVNMIHLNSKSL